MHFTLFGVQVLYSIIQVSLPNQFHSQVYYSIWFDVDAFFQKIFIKKKNKKRFLHKKCFLN